MGRRARNGFAEPWCVCMRECDLCFLGAARDELRSVSSIKFPRITRAPCGSGSAIFLWWPWRGLGMRGCGEAACLPPFCKTRRRFWRVLFVLFLTCMTACC